MKIHRDFRDLLAEFVGEKVEFMVIGGYAVAHYDRPRYTKDIDLWISPAATNIEAASRALTSFGAPPHIINGLRNAREDEIVWLGTPPLRIDLLPHRIDRLSRQAHASADAVQRIRDWVRCHYVAYQRQCRHSQLCASIRES